MLVRVPHFGSLNQLKIGQQVAFGLMGIATRASREYSLSTLKTFNYNILMINIPRFSIPSIYNDPYMPQRLQLEIPQLSTLNQISTLYQLFKDNDNFL